MAEGKGYGKCILFNEHFVVYGIPSIVSAIGDTTVAKVEKSGSTGVTLVDNRPATPGYKEEKKEQQKDSLHYMLDAMDINPDQNITITLGGSLYAASGIGASAASCTAIARALNQFFDMGFSDEEINKVAYQGERGYHGTPSGVDNTASTYGGLIWFIKGDNKNTVERLEIKKPVKVVMGNTGKVANTKKAVAGVRERKEKYPEKYSEIFKKAEKVVRDARKAFEQYDMKDIGNLMNKNHELLQKIEVSNNDLDMLVETARDTGAFGAKMTGGGLGGYMVALTPTKEIQNTVARSIEEKGFRVLRTEIGV